MGRIFLWWDTLPTEQYNNHSSILLKNYIRKILSNIKRGKRQTGNLEFYTQENMFQKNQDQLSFLIIY